MAVSFDSNITRKTRINQELKKRIDLSNSSAMVLLMNGYDFERELVAILVELIESKGLKHEPIAERAWPDRKDAGPAWQKIRNKVPPQKLTIRDAFNMAQVLGVGMTELCGIVQGRVMQKSLSQK